MSVPKLSYPFMGRRQAVSGSTRPICASLSALASGRASGILVSDPEGALNQYLDDRGVHPALRERWIRALKGAKYGGTPPDTVLGLRLDEYQTQAIQKLSSCGGVLALGCGLGKTAIAVAAIQGLTPPVSRVVIVCPVNAFSTWHKAEEALKHITPDVMIVSMDSLHRLTGLPPDGGVVVFDEVHMLGEPNTRRTKAAHAIRLAFDFGLGLTGTFLHGGVHKVPSIIDLAVPGGAGFSSLWKAGDAFQCVVKKKVSDTRTVRALEKPTGENAVRFQQYLSTFVQSMTTSTPAVRAAFELPTQHTHTVAFGEPWESLEDAAVRAAEEIMEEEPDTVPHFQQVVHRLLREGAELKLDWLRENVSLDEDQVVIFCAYLESMDLICAALPPESRVRVDGTVTGPDRVQAERAFQDGSVPVLVGQFTAASVSLNLQNCRFSVGFDFTRRAVDYTQGLARTARRGQEQETHHWDLVANRLQDHVRRTLRARQNFDASVAEWQSMRAFVSERWTTLAEQE